MKLTRIDLNSWIVELAGQRILVDPWLVDPLTFYGMAWLFSAYHTTPLALTPETLPAIDLILLSQGLDDHCHQPTLERIARTIPVVASSSAAKVVKRLGYQQVTTLTPWQSQTFGEVVITAVQGASVQPGDVENGYLLRDKKTGQTLYYEPHLPPFDQLANQVGTVDVVVAPVVGQQFPLLGQVIIGPEEALRLAHVLKPKAFVPTALGDIRAEGILPSMIKSIGSIEEFRDRLLASGLSTQFLQPAAGETIEIALPQRI
jgi:L-ascorbate metabolism protein UlaG (beta-lactamase superfamily)